jgi:hypothetical protein
VVVGLDGTEYLAVYEEGQYRLSIPNADYIPGEYVVNATGYHLYASNPASSTAMIRVETDEVQISRAMPDIVEQDEEFDGWLNITDMFDNPLENAQVILRGGDLELVLEELEPGCYHLNATASLSIGNHSFDIYVEHEFLQGTNFGEFSVVTIGSLNVEVPEIAPVVGGEMFNVTVFVSDIYGAIPSDTWVVAEIDGRNVTASHLAGGRFRAQLNATYPMGEWSITIFYGSEFSYDGAMMIDLFVMSDPVILRMPADDWSVEQSESTNIEVEIADWLGIRVDNAILSVLIRGTTYNLEPMGGGLYQTDISTVGWPFGVHRYYLIIEHLYMYPSQTSGNLTVIADPTIRIIPSTMEPVQQSILTIDIEVTDLYGNPISGLEVSVDFASMQTSAEETDIPGVYFAAFDVGNTYHNWYNISVTIEGELSEPHSNHMPVFVEVFTPRLQSLNAGQISIAAGISLVLSLIGMMIFVKVSSAISTKPRKEDDIKRSITQLDRVYALLVGLTGLLFVHSWFLYLEGQFLYSLIEGIILLGASVLLYGLWLYRDAYTSILVDGSLSKKRIALGIWHLILVPFIVFLIFTYGAQLEHFQRYILEVPQFALGEISIPPLLATILGTYMSSIVVVVISFYRENRKGLDRIDDMVAAATPQDVVEEEQALLIGRTGSSIRIKFLMFLLILGATTIMQLEFLRNYSMAAIVLIPVVFLVLIPFISSRIVKGGSRAVRRMRRHNEEESDLNLLE